MSLKVTVSLDNSLFYVINIHYPKKGCLNLDLPFNDLFYIIYVPLCLRRLNVAYAERSNFYLCVC